MAVRIPVNYTCLGIRNNQLNVVPGATVSVFESGTTTLLAQSLWSAAIGGVAQTNPMTADATGSVHFWLDTAQNITISWVSPGWAGTVDQIEAGPGVGLIPDLSLTYQALTGKNQPNGYAGLDGGTKVPVAEIPDISATYQAASGKNQPNGYAGLDAGTKVPVAEIPDISATYQATAAKNLANGYAGLNGAGKLTLAQMQEIISMVDLADVSGTPAPGSGLRRNNNAYAPNGLRFSMVAYGVVPCLSSDAATSAANSTARDACLAAALASGDGSMVELDWIGTACFSTAGTIYLRLIYQGTMYNVSKLMDGATAGTHVWQTLNFPTLTQTLPANFGVGAYEFTFRDHYINGNKAANLTGGNGLSIFGYGYYLDNLLIENCHSAGWWTEWSNSNEPIDNPPSSNHQRAFYVGRIQLFNNDCANVAAVNTRATEARAAVTGGQACVFGPGDSIIHDIDCVRDGSVAGIGLNQGLLDFNAGTIGSFDLTIDNCTVWLNHNKAVYLAGGNAIINYLHAEGANTNLEIASQGVKVIIGKVFYPQPGGTNVLLSSGFNGGYLNLAWESAPVAQTHLNITGATCQNAEIIGEMDFGHAVTFTAVAGSLPTNCRRINIFGYNYGGATVTPGWLPLVPGSTTIYGIDWHQAPVVSLTGIGYAAGAGGTVVQATSKATGVTLNTMSGQITMNAASLAAATAVSFTVTDNRVAATDTPIVVIKSGATAGAYRATVDAVAAGSFQVSLKNESAGALAEAVVLGFNIIKGVTA